MSPVREFTGHQRGIFKSLISKCFSQCFSLAWYHFLWLVSGQPCRSDVLVFNPLIFWCLYIIVLLSSFLVLHLGEV
jgi:hypothetical protein